jgi:hypothetical protein
VTTSSIVIADGYAIAPLAPGNGIDRDWAVIDARAMARRRVSAKGT